MIMAGRGKRLGDLVEANKKVGAAPSEEPQMDLPTVIKSINEINISNVNPSTLASIQNSFKQLCTSKDKMKDILTDFHDKALSGCDFGDKLLLALEPVFNFEIDEVRVRNELLSFMQNDFASKDSLSSSDHKKFLNAVGLLGSGYRRIKVCGAPISVLGVALLEYFDMLLKGDEEDLKVLSTQILLNGEILSKEDKLTDKYILLQHNLRNSLITGSLNNSSKYWILLSVEFMSNNFRPFTEAIKDFYTKNLGEEFKKLEPLMEVSKSDLNMFSSPESVKSQDSIKNKSFDSDHKRRDGGRRDLSEKFSDINITKDESKGKGRNIRRDNPKWQNDDKPRRSGKGNPASGHDDRFDKDEDFYGAQMPRRPKPENTKKNFSEQGNKKGGNDDLKSPVGDKNKESGSSPKKSPQKEETEKWD